jgi:hypothetical protein
MVFVFSIHTRMVDACMHMSHFFKKNNKWIPEIEQQKYVHIDGLGEMPGRAWVTYRVGFDRRLRNRLHSCMQSWIAVGPVRNHG